VRKGGLDATVNADRDTEGNTIADVEGIRAAVEDASSVDRGRERASRT
jgi:hypothetical protein